MKINQLLITRYIILDAFLNYNEIFVLQTDLADLISVVGMVASDEGSYESLKFTLLGTRRNLIEWGHEYLRSLAGEIG